MSYPNTTFEYRDNSATPILDIATPTIKPMFLVSTTTDKGEEGYAIVEGEDFFKRYGKNISFQKHGQPLLNAAAIINAGGRLMMKRVVAPDSAIANITIYADIVNAQKTNEAGEPLFIDAVTGQETTVPDGNTPIMITTITYMGETLTGQANSADAAAAGYAAVLGKTPVEGHFYYPLFTITDIGRGVSNKKFQILPDYASSKSLNFVAYMFNIFEADEKLEGIQFGLYPDIVNLGQNVSIESMIKRNSNQLKVVEYDADIKAFITKFAEFVGITPDEAVGVDALFGRTKKGVMYPNVIIDTATAGAINLSNISGNGIENGSNGSFGNAPITLIDDLKEIYDTEIAKTFNGEAGPEIYDRGNYPITAIIDANYAPKVKKVINDLVTYREDCMYFRDYGTSIRTFDSLVFEATAENGPYVVGNKFIADYMLAYDIIDPYSLKQITVTIGYALCTLLVNHINNGTNRPFAGIVNSVVLTNVIRGTENIMPVVTPVTNQKETLSDMRLNYAGYYNNQLVMETLYNTQEALSEFSYVNNILAIQEVIRAVRAQCPMIRYSFTSGDDLEKYKKDIQKVLDLYSGNFISLTMEYLQDEVYIANKIFYAVITVAFKQFSQAEHFIIEAVPSV